MGLGLSLNRGPQSWSEPWASSSGGLGLIPEWVDRELENWAHWCFSGGPVGPQPPKRARSLEGRYSAPSWDEEVPTRRPEPNQKAAEKIQEIYLLKLSKQEKQLVVYLYIKRLPKAMILRVMRLQDSGYAALEEGVVRQVVRNFAWGNSEVRA